jgi:tetratricopeptide (TPR) repeat protein
MKIRSSVVAAAAALSALGGVACTQVKAMAAFKDGNRYYTEEQWRRAIEKYEEAISLRPDMAEAHFYLASSHQALHRPGREEPENLERLEKAVEHYHKALELNQGDTENLRRVRANTLGALTTIYSEPPKQDFEKALAYAQDLVRDAPDDTKNLFAIANLYEKFGRVEEAEKTYLRVAELNPEDTKACGAVAAFYNKPLWDDRGEVWRDGTDRPRRAKFEQAIETLGRCAALDPDDASGYHKVASFYWDKAYRDPLLSDEQKETYADKGLEAIDKALEIRPDYWEAVIYKGLLYRVKAQVARTPRVRQEYIERATQLQRIAGEMRKQQMEVAGGDAPAPDVPPEAAPPTGTD